MAGYYAPSFYAGGYGQPSMTTRAASSASLLTAIPMQAYPAPQYAAAGPSPLYFASGAPSAFAAPPGAYAQPPVGYAPPNAGYAPPPARYAPPPSGYAPPPAGYAPPPAGYAPPSAGYAPPSAGYSPPSAGYAPPSAGYAQPPVGHAPRQYQIAQHATAPHSEQSPAVYSEYIPASGLSAYNQPRQYARPAPLQQQGVIYNAPPQAQNYVVQAPANQSSLQLMHGSAPPQPASNSFYQAITQNKRDLSADSQVEIRDLPNLFESRNEQQQPAFYNADSAQAAPQNHSQGAKPSIYAMESLPPAYQLKISSYAPQAPRAGGVCSGQRLASAHGSVAPAQSGISMNNAWAGARSQQPPPVIYGSQQIYNNTTQAPTSGHAIPSMYAPSAQNKQKQQSTYEEQANQQENNLGQGGRGQNSQSGTGHGHHIQHQGIQQLAPASYAAPASSGRAAPAVSVYCGMQDDTTYAFDAPPLAYRNQRSKSPSSGRSPKAARSVNSAKSQKSVRQTRGASAKAAPNASSESLSRAVAALKMGTVNLRQNVDKLSEYHNEELRTARRASKANY